MTHGIEVARGRGVVERWCALAEARLEYLTELFETGRWRRYHGERAFLENIQEAKSAVQIWRDLSVREASLDNAAVDMSWLGRGKGSLSRSEPLHDQLRRPQVQAVSVAAEPPPQEVYQEVSIAVQAELVVADEAPSAPAIDDVVQLTLDIAAMQERYPLLRNAL
jgi:uncharacterized repeat protein (TIGR03809 family)